MGDNETKRRDDAFTKALNSHGYGFQYAVLAAGAGGKTVPCPRSRLASKITLVGNEPDVREDVRNNSETLHLENEL